MINISSNMYLVQFTSKYFSDLAKIILWEFFLRMKKKCFSYEKLKPSYQGDFFSEVLFSHNKCQFMSWTTFAFMVLLLNVSILPKN